MNKPEKFTPKPLMDYHDMVSYIDKKYGIEVRDYHKYYSKDADDWRSYMDYWHWLLDNCFYEINNPCTSYFNIGEILEDESTPPWIKEITQLFYNEFEGDLDKDGGIDVYISW